MGRVNWKQRLRAWLIDIVRDAIRLEREAQAYAEQVKRSVQPTSHIPLAVKPASNVVTTPIDKSFEQLERESITEQEKYYANTQ